MVAPITPALLEFRGPDAVRFLNGQITQDVRRVVGGKISLPSCVTDAKGKLQFRVTITESNDGALWVAGPVGTQESLETRLTRYLIADDVEVTDLTGKYQLIHLIEPAPEAPPGVLVRDSNRYGLAGSDWWIAAGSKHNFSEHTCMTENDLEALRIDRGVPAWGNELLEGMLPPEALLEVTDISYNKGCYIGQEVISRIKSAGKVNRRLTLFVFDAEAPVVPGFLVGPDGGIAGELTSVSPSLSNGVRHALGYIKRGASECLFRTADGLSYQATFR